MFEREIIQLRCLYVESPGGMGEGWIPIKQEAEGINFFFALWNSLS